MHDKPPKLLTPLGGFFLGLGQKRPWLAGTGPRDRRTPPYNIIGKEVYRQ
jgi:hypothetical protein